MLPDKKKCIMFFALFVLAVAAFADTGSLTERFLDKANDEYSAGNVREAYNTVNRALLLNKNGKIPENVILMAQTIYAARLEIVKEHPDDALFNDIVEHLTEYPSVASSAVKSLVRQITEQQAKADAALTEAKENAQHEETLRMHKEDIQAQRENQNRLIEKIDSSIGALGTGLSESAEQTRMSFRTIMIAILIIAVVLFLVFLVVMLIIKLAMRNSHNQHEQIEATLKMVASIQNTANSNMLRLGGVTDLYGKGLKLAGSSRWGVDALPEPNQTEEEKKDVQDLAIKCEDLGAKIDQVTKRKNNSKNVSELVYKLAIQLGVQQQKAILYFCSGMVYDAGFLGIDPGMLTAETLTDDERLMLRKHIELADEYLQFVPKKYWDIFRDAATMHHANMDGSGYPENVSGENIPQIARLIRVAETYISLSSRRNYRAITDKETAIETLKQQPEFYDQDVVDALDAIV